jgi:hypothetical protein
VPNATGFWKLPVSYFGTCTTPGLFAVELMSHEDRDKGVSLNAAGKRSFHEEKPLPGDLGGASR